MNPASALCSLGSSQHHINGKVLELSLKVRKQYGDQKMARKKFCDGCGWHDGAYAGYLDRHDHSTLGHN
jgi:hypothetical protein